jgi:hypothetical protein
VWAVTTFDCQIWAPLDSESAAMVSPFITNARPNPMAGA